MPSVSDSVAGTVPPTLPAVDVEVGASIASHSSAVAALAGRSTASRAAASAMIPRVAVVGEQVEVEHRLRTCRPPCRALGARGASCVSLLAVAG